MKVMLAALAEKVTSPWCPAVAKELEAEYPAAWAVSPAAGTMWQTVHAIAACELPAVM